MNKEIKEKWVAALRSGEYPQCEGVLQDAHGYCCLGVLADVIGIDIKRGLNDTYLKIRQKAEITEEIEQKCVELNDINHCNFHEIAQFVEAKL